jgi:hypothetical protein
MTLFYSSVVAWLSQNRTASDILHWSSLLNANWLVCHYSGGSSVGLWKGQVMNVVCILFAAMVQCIAVISFPKLLASVYTPWENWFGF